MTRYAVVCTKDGTQFYLRYQGVECYLATDIPERAIRWADRAEASRRAMIERRNPAWAGFDWRAE